MTDEQIIGPVFRCPRCHQLNFRCFCGLSRVLTQPVRLWERCCAGIKQVEASATSRHFRNARAAVGMDWLHFHDLRHSAASAMINAGVDLYTVGGVLGHKSAISTKRYSHLITETMRAAIGRIGGQKLTHQGPVGKGKKTA